MPSSLITGASLPPRADDLMSALARVPDPRDRRGVRYALCGVLALAVSAVIAGSRSFAATGEWAADLPGQALARLGLDEAPDESTLRKLFARLDAAALDKALALFAWTRVREIGGRRVIAIDGKTVRGARGAGQAAPHLVAALEHDTGVVLGQIAVADKSNEIPALRDLLNGFDPDDLRGCVITADAMHTQADTAQLILDAGADYVFTVKANQPGLHKRLKELPWRDVPARTSTQTGRGRRSTRTIKVADAPAWTAFGGAAQVAQLRRTRTIKTNNGQRKTTVEVVYLITSAAFADARPDTLAAWVQSHWSIENRLHWVRDVTYGEDLSQTRTGAAPHVMASLRNTAITIFRLAGWPSIAAATRHHSRHPDRAITCLLTC